jgi:uncharacterized protein YecT (DUF1311 family)
MMARRMILSAIAVTIAFAVTTDAQAQSRKPTAAEVAAIHACAEKNKDDLDKGEQNCLFKLIADRCIGSPGSASDGVMADCYQIEGAAWDGLLNENYKTLLASLDEGQAAKARAMQRAWVAYRDTTCGFYYDKIQGTMAGYMGAACEARETARRAMLLAFFGRV